MERWPFLFFFVGVALTAFGSSYYHLHPANDRLVWDRLPMTIGFMVLVAAVIAERISVRVGVRLLAPLLLLGIFSVFYWNLTECAGRGDLRPYALVQFGSLLAILLLIAVYPSRYTRGSDTSFRSPSMRSRKSSKPPTAPSSPSATSSAATP